MNFPGLSPGQDGLPPLQRRHSGARHPGGRGSAQHPRRGAGAGGREAWRFVHLVG